MKLGKRLISFLVAFILALSLIPATAFTVFASQTDTESDFAGTVYISYSHDGQFAQGNTESGYMDYVPVKLEDLVEIMDDQEYFYDPNEDGVNDIVVYWLLKYCLDKYGRGTEDWSIENLGSGSAYMTQGTWHLDDGTPWDQNLNYYVNGAYPLAGEAWGATLDQITLHDGDFVDVMHYSGWSFWMDENAGFQYFAGDKYINDYADGNVETAGVDGTPGYVVHEFSGTAGEPVNGALVKAFGDLMSGGGTAYQPFENTIHYGSDIYQELASVQTDEDGMFAITFPEAGDYWIWTNGTESPDSGEIVNAPAVAKVHIEAASQPVGTDPTALYTNGVDGSGWIAYNARYGTVESVSLSQVRVIDYLWDGNTCEVTLANDTSADAAITFTTVMSGNSVARAYMSYNGTGKQGANTTWSTTLTDGEATIILYPYFSTTSLSGTKKTIHITTAEVDHGTLTNLEITTPPTQTAYYSGEAFDPSGMVVTATYADGFITEVAHKRLAFSPAIIAADTTEVTVSFEGETAVQPITVTPLPDFISIVDYSLNTGSVDMVEIQDVNGTGLTSVAELEVSGLNINVTLDRTIDPAAKVKAVFTLTQNGEGYPFLSSDNTMRAANYKTNAFTTTLSSGSGTARAYLYNHAPKATAANPDATFVISYAIENNLPVRAEGVAASKEETVIAESSYELDLTQIFTDADGDEMTYLVAVNGGAAESANAAYSFLTDQMGSYSLVFTANDGYGTSVETYTVNLTVERKEGTYYITHTSGTGYSTEGAEGSSSPVNEGESYTVKLNVTNGYIRGESFAVKANGVALTEDSEDSNLFTISNITADQTITVEGIEEKKPVIIAPAGSTITLGTGPGASYYQYSWIDPVKVETLPDGRVQNTYNVVSNSYLFYRIQNPNGVTYWNYISKLERGDEIVVTGEEIHLNDEAFNKDTVYHNFEYNNLDLADIYLNINERGYLALSTGQTYELNSFRNWFAIESFTNAKVALPDFHYEVMDINGNPSDLVTIVPDTHNSGLATLTAGQGTGLAIVKITYDAMIHKQGMSSGYGAGGEDPTRFSHIWPETSGIFVVTVGEPDGSSINMGMTINVGTHAGKVAGDNIDAEHDPLYYVGEDGASFTFSPDSGATVSIARSSVTSNGLTYSGFTTEGVTTDENGNVTVTGLTDGRHIVKVEKDGVANYQILTARQINVTFTDAQGNERAADYQWKPGDEVTITLSQIDSPQEKLSGYYNNSFAVSYEDEPGNVLSNSPSYYGQYDFSTATHSFTTTIPADWDKSTFSFTNGAVSMGGFSGGAAGSHRTCRYLTGKGMTPGTAGSGVLGSMPDIILRVQQNTSPHLAEGVEATAVAEVLVGSPYSLDLTQIFTDDENDELTYLVSVNGGEQVAVEANYSYQAENAGTITLKFYANDGTVTSTDTYEVTLSVTAAPVLTDSLTVIDEDCNIWQAYVALHLDAPEIYMEEDLRPAYQIVIAEPKDIVVTESEDDFELTGEHYINNLATGETVVYNETANSFTLKAGDYQSLLGEAQTIFGEANIPMDGFNIDPESQIALFMVDGVNDPELAPLGLTGYYLIITLDDNAEPTATEQHQWDEGKLTSQSTFTEKGTITYTCQNNPNHTKTEEIDKLLGFTVKVNGTEISAANIEILDGAYDASYEDWMTGEVVENKVPLAIVTLPDSETEMVEITLNDYAAQYQNYIYTREPDETGYTQYVDYGFGDQVGDYTYIATAGTAYETAVLPTDQVYRVQTAYDENYVSYNLYAIAFEKPAPVTTVDVDFTSQMMGGFLHAPQDDYEVASDLAESYGYSDAVDGVSVLDVLVAAHELVFGEDFSAETAANYLVMGTTGAPTKMFGTEGDSSAYFEPSFMGMFFYNHGWPNDGTLDEGGYYTGTLFTTQEVNDDDLVEFFFNESGYFADTYTWFIDAEGNYSRTFSVQAGEDLDLTLCGAWIPDPAQRTKDEMDLVNYDGILDELDEVQIYTVDLDTGAKTPIDDAVTDYGDVTLNFTEPGTYTITAYTDEDDMNTYIMTLTTIIVEEEEIPVTTPVFNGHNLNLSAEIGVGFRVVFPENFDPDGCYVEFEVPCGKTATVQYTEAEPAGENALCFTFGVNALELEETITATLHYGDGETVTDEYSVMTYIDTINNGSYNQKLKDLVNALHAYGYYMQFTGWTDKYAPHATKIDPPNQQLQLTADDIAEAKDAVSSMNDYVDDVDPAVIADYKVRLSLNAKTVIDVAVKPAAGVKVTSTDCTRVKIGKETYYMFKTDAIGPKGLGTNKEVPVETSGGNATVNCSAMSYVNRMFNNPLTSEEEEYALTAYYKYFAAARDYN